MASSCHCVVFLFLIVAGWCRATEYDILDFELARKHELWMAKYGRVYKDEAEKAQRFEIFKKNVKYIEDFNNARKHKYTLGINQFADLTNKEFSAMYTGGFYFSKESLRSFKFDEMVEQRNYTSLPSSVDWRDEGAVTPVKLQGTCDGCWAFTAVAAVEGLIKIKKGVLYELSQQQLIDCDQLNGGCGGGYVHAAFKYIVRNGGITSEANYPYKGAVRNCNRFREIKHVATISGYESVTKNNEKELMAAVARQPVAVGVDASSDDFQFYKSGVFHGSCGTSLNHAMTIVGYGKEGSDNYWLVKNSYGDKWGEAGYIRMEKDIAAPEGLCGIAKTPYYPTLKP